MDKLQSPGLHQQIENNIAGVRRRIAGACERSGRSSSEVKLIAVVKNFPAQVVRTAIECGITDLGENRVQEAETKYQDLVDVRSGIKLHFIGHLQTNKVKEAVKLFDIIHSVDSLKLASKLSEGASAGVPVLIQVNLAGEETKYGFSADGLESAVNNIVKLSKLEVLGLMTIAPLVGDPEEVRPIFKRLKYLNGLYGFKELSMGMTDDFEVAIEEGATMVRIGRAIFGERS